LNYQRGLVVATIAAFVMTLLGAFGTGEVPLVQRLIYWLVIMESGALIGIGASAGVRAWGGVVERPVLEGTLISFLIALPLTLVVLGVTLIFFGGQAPPLTSLAATFVGVFAVTGVITAINYSRSAAAEANVSQSISRVDDVELAEPLSSSIHRPKLLDRLPPHLRDAELHAIQAEDHYLRVYTSAGSDLILFRMNDAMGEVDGIVGARTHRSWWVAHGAIRSIERRDGRAELALPGNVVVPVSRTYMRQLQDMGWSV
jgi:hypothetical protein